MKNKNPLEILVVEDNPKHQKAARELLGEYNLTVVGTFDEAADYLHGKQKKQYDAVLTDMFFTQGRGEMMKEKSMGQIEMPFGYAVALMACKEGIPNVAIVSDANHHDNPIAYTLDFFEKGNNQAIIQKVGESKLAVIISGHLKHCYLKSDGSVTSESPYRLPEDSPRLAEFVEKDGGFQTVKNWKAALEHVLNGEIDIPRERKVGGNYGLPAGGMKIK